MIDLSDDFKIINDEEFLKHDALIERLLLCHLDRRHLFLLSPRIIIRIRNLITLGPQASAALSKVEQSYLDYRSVSRVSLRVIIIVPYSGIVPAFPSDRECHVRAQDLNSFLNEPPRLFVENAVADGRFYELIAKLTCEQMHVPSVYMRVDKQHGGGNTLAAVIRHLHGSDLHGVCICDRDCIQAVPPFGVGTTGGAALEALVSLGLAIAAEGYITILKRSFYFLVTHGWSLENYIGPSLLDLFFSHRPEARAARPDFVRAFPQFPQLSDNQMLEWWMINFKAVQPLATLVNGYVYLQAGELANEERLELLAELTIPTSVIPWIIDNSYDTRHSRAVHKAILDDMANETYRVALYDLAKVIFTVCAADDRAKFL